MVTVTDIQMVVQNVVSAKMAIPSILTFVVCVTLALLTPFLFNLLRGKEDLVAVQSAHTQPTLRLGGLGILIGLIVGVFVFHDVDGLVLFASVLLLSAVPLMLAGFAEDLGFYLQPMIRLGAIALSSLFCAVLLPGVIRSLGLTWLDTVLAYYPIALVFTIFAASGVINAFNLIDGLNGLASFTAITTACSLAALAMIGSLEHLTYFYLLFAIVTFGFFVLNYPVGKLFLGDGGAYLLGCCLVWGGITLANQVAGLSAFAILLIFFWPVADTTLSIWRRFHLSAPTSRPDRLHFHQLVMRFLEIRILGRSRRSLANPLATLILAPLIVTPQICGLIFAFNHSAAVVSSIALSFIFFTTYALGMYLAKRSHVRKHIKVQGKA